MNNRIKSYIIVVVMLVVFSNITTMLSCTHAEPEFPVSFRNDIIPILTSNCLAGSNCHFQANGTNHQTSFTADSAYATIVNRRLVNLSNPVASLLYAVVAENQMPKLPYVPLTANQKNLILKWIQEGAKNN